VDHLRNSNHLGKRARLKDFVGRRSTKFINERRSRKTVQEEGEGRRKNIKPQKKQRGLGAVKGAVKNREGGVCLGSCVGESRKTKDPFWRRPGYQWNSTGESVGQQMQTDTGDKFNARRRKCARRAQRNVRPKGDKSNRAKK